MSFTSRIATSNPSTTSLAVVIPTRNRADLAIKAIRSALDQPGFPLQVLVSDNSSRPEDVRRLEDFCRRLGDARLVYMRPPELLPMPAHWDWAMQQALERTDASHFTIHYDRKVSKPGHLSLVSQVAARYPHQVLTFIVDLVMEDPPPAVLYQPPWTGKVYEIQTSRVLEMTSHGMINEMGQAFPVMSNCIIPRRVLEEIQDRFGNICNSTGPDACFTYRYCSLNDSYLHFDRPLGIVHASHRSNGLGYLRGRTSGDFGDFLNSWGDKPWLDAAPIPGMNLGQNILFHEYVLVQRAVGDQNLPPIEMDGYMRGLATGLQWVEEPRMRAAMRAVLEKHGWREEIELAAPAVLTEVAIEAAKTRRPLYRRLTPGRLLAAVRARVHNRWWLTKSRQGFVLFLADYFGIKPPHIHCFTFSSNEEAVRYALTYPRRPEMEDPYIQVLEPSEVDFTFPRTRV